MTGMLDSVSATGTCIRLLKKVLMRKKIDHLALLPPFANLAKPGPGPEKETLHSYRRHTPFTISIPCIMLGNAHSRDVERIAGNVILNDIFFSLTCYFI
jgi:hypothetical protein